MFLQLHCAKEQLNMMNYIFLKTANSYLDNIIPTNLLIIPVKLY